MKLTIFAAICIVFLIVIPTFDKWMSVEERLDMADYTDDLLDLAPVRYQPPTDMDFGLMYFHVGDAEPDKTLRDYWNATGLDCALCRVGKEDSDVSLH